jgi:hypothetical protein
LSLFNPRTAATLAQSTFSPLAATRAIVSWTPISNLLGDAPKLDRFVH